MTKPSETSEPGQMTQNYSKSTQGSEVLHGCEMAAETGLAPFTRHDATVRMYGGLWCTCVTEAAAETTVRTLNDWWARTGTAPSFP